MSPTLEILAAAAGVLTVASPCILPILPILLGASAPGGQRHRPFWIVLGLSASFALFGAAFAVFGSVLGLSNAALRYAAMAILLFFGLSLLWPRVWERAGSRIGALAQGLPGANRLPAEQGRGAALLVGGSLGLVWAPCAGPILGIVLTLSAVQGSFSRSLLLLGGYALGAALPMLAIGYGGRELYRKIAPLGAWGECLRKVMGAATIVTVAALFFNLDTLLLARLPDALFPAGRLEKRLAAGASGVPADGDSPPGIARASAGGTTLPVLGTMPEFAKIAAWINSPPLTAAGLRGKVVLVDFWTYSCINCIRTLPHVTRWYEKYKDMGFTVVGVHTPEFSFEKDEANVRKAVARYGIRYPVALDDSYGTWTAYNNDAWPADYLFDARGRLREVHLGEGEYEATERAIASLLMEAKLLRAPLAVDRAKAGVDFSLIESPETYVGYRRAENFSSPGGEVPDLARNYAVPATLGLNGWALRGTWKIGAEAALLEAPGGGIRFRFKARELNLVMKGPREGAPAVVLLDGMRIPAALRGADVGQDGGLVVGESRLYNLVRLPAGAARDHVFGIDIETPGVALYAFTFG